MIKNCLYILTQILTSTRVYARIKGKLLICETLPTSLNLYNAFIPKAYNCIYKYFMDLFLWHIIQRQMKNTNAKFTVFCLTVYSCVWILIGLLVW